MKQQQTYQSNIWKLDGYSLLTALSVFSAALMPILTVWGGLSFTEALLLQSWFTISVFLLEIPTGVVADVFGRKISLLASAIIGVLGFLIYGSQPALWIFVIGEFLLALSFALRSGAAEALLFDSLADKTTAAKTFSRNGSLALLGVALGPAIGAFLLQFFPMERLMTLTAIPFLIALLLMLFVQEPTQHSEEKESQRIWQTFSEGIRFFKQEKELQLLALDMGMVAGLSKMMVWLYQPVIQTQGLPLHILGYFFAFSVVLEIIFMNLYSHFHGKGQTAQRIIFWSGLLPAIGLIMIGLSHWWWLSVVGMWLTIGIGMSRKPFFASIFNQKITSAKRATILSTIAMSSQLVLIPLNPIVGKLADWSVQYTLLGLGIILAGFVVWMRWRIYKVQL